LSSVEQARAGRVAGPVARSGPSGARTRTRTRTRTRDPLRSSGIQSTSTSTSTSTRWWPDPRATLPVSLQGAALGWPERTED